MGVSEEDFRCPAWEAKMRAQAVPSSQAVADRLIATGYAGMLVRSFARRANADEFNLVMWGWGPQLPVRVALD